MRLKRRYAAAQDNDRGGGKPLIPRKIAYVATVYLAGMACFTLCRLILLWRNFSLLDFGVDNSAQWIWEALLMGVRFDNVVSFYLLALPLLLLLVGQFIPRCYKALAQTAKWWITVTYSVAIMMCVGDIPFFEQFRIRLNAVMFNYVDGDMGFVVRMVGGEWQYILFSVAAIAVAGLFVFANLRLARRWAIHHAEATPRRTTIILIVLCLLTPLSIRGRLSRKSPIRVGTAYISNNAFINQLGLNPVFTLMRSSLDMNGMQFEVQESGRARAFAAWELGRDSDFGRHFEAHPSPFKNVVVLLMESNTADRLRSEGSREGLSPNLDTLVTRGLYFRNAYSTGIHTYNGVYSTLTSFPSYLDKHTMKASIIPSLHTIPEQMMQQGMSTIFFTTHDAQFDNMSGFALGNGIQSVVSEPDYDSGEVVSTLGVPDHVMYDKALEILDAKHEAGQRFCAVMLSSSNHPPYNIPYGIDFKPSSREASTQVAEYADWAMRRFLDLASTREWFDSTLFVITGDHGKAIDNDYAISLSYNHIPILFYSPANIAPELRDDMASQMDIMPTAAGMLGLEFVNRSFGIDLLSETRRIVPFSTDHEVAAIDCDWLYVYSYSGELEYLYDRTATGDDRYRNVAEENGDVVKRMHEYAASMMQAAWDIHHNYTSDLDLDKKQ
ncbi:MAG: sulfatase-like hydrolase/transferase [Alistipes sp.]|nr:sulfatase-like hydrolase/transferase [Alistipes sp.]